MLLGLLLHSAFAGGAPAWDPNLSAQGVVTAPITVHVVESVDGYTRVEITNNLSRDLSVLFWTSTPDSAGDMEFRVHKEQADALCPESIAATPPGDSIPQYTRCDFLMRPGEQHDVILVYAPPESGEVLGEVTVHAYIYGENPVRWGYTVEKLLIARSAAAKRDPRMN